MAKQIIILETKLGPNGQDTLVNWVFWLIVPTGAETPIPDAKSRYRDALPEDIAAIANGSIIEEYYSTQWIKGSGPEVIKLDIKRQLTTRQTQLNARANPNAYYGGYWDTVTGWSF